MGDPPTLISTSPGFTGQTAPDDIPGLFDNVFYAEVVGGGDNRSYKCTTVGTEILVAKTRWSGVFKTTEMNPNFLNFVKRIQTATEPISKKK